ncbi:MAG: hypothetical protein AAB383_03345 [Patescibacteria group bacterium]
MNLTITNRELLRNYKSLKDKLLQKKVDIIEVDLDEEYLLEIKLKRKKRPKTPFEESLELIEQHDFSYLKRPEADLFDYF